MITHLVSFSHEHLPQLHAMGYISLTKKRLHQDQISELDYLIFVTSGSFYITENDQSYKITKGMYFFRKAGTHALGHTFMEPGTSWYWLSFNTIESTYDLPKHIESVDYLSDQKYLAIMFQLYTSHKALKTHHLNTKLQNLFYDLVDRSDVLISGPNPLVAQVDQILEELLYDKFDGKKIAKALQLDYSYIGKCYKEHKGMTINQYYTHLKIQQAIKYLEEGSMNIGGISDKLAYPNPYYFSRVFKKVTGLSPKDYRKQMYFTN